MNFGKLQFANLFSFSPLPLHPTTATIERIPHNEQHVVTMTATRCEPDALKIEHSEIRKLPKPPNHLAFTLTIKISKFEF